ncbi:MAG: hypothetical protein GY774_10680 [Planctomycetes bacterium]|nr:hypothetical protein [Planctomycetota bacterium]
MNSYRITSQPLIETRNPAGTLALPAVFQFFLRLAASGARPGLDGPFFALLA